ncbi:MAG TPA: HDOD domain-containing protein, partial [Steroidobacteraceae bacterium]|nr:HDOD domain-containing protein [Steroidobacteraceae bacterium]
GVLAMLQQRAPDPLTDIRSLESRYSLVHHEDCGAIVFESWNLPETLVTVAAHHHRPSETPSVHRQLAELVHAGASVAVSCGHTSALEPSPRADSLELMHRFGLDGEAATGLLSTLHEKVSDLHGVIAED